MVTDQLINNDMKAFYTKPAAEELDWRLCSAILDGSVEGNLESYGEENDFTW